MKKFVNASDIQRNGLKEVYKTIDEYGEAFILNQRTNKLLIVKEKDSPQLLPNIIMNLRKIKKLLNDDFGIQKIGIFGSYVRGDNDIDSDLDIVIDKNLDDIHAFIKVENIVREALKIKKIDLLEMKTIKPFIWENIEQEVIYV